MRGIVPADLPTQEHTVPTAEEQTRVSITGPDGIKHEVGNFNDFKSKLEKAAAKLDVKPSTREEKIAAYDAKFHPENEAVNAKKLPKGPDGPGMNDDGPYADLPIEYRTKFEEADEEAIRTEAAQVTFNEVANQVNKANDQQLKEAKAAAREAAEQYTDATKANKLKQKFLRSILESRGQEPAPRDLDLQSAT